MKKGINRNHKTLLEQGQASCSKYVLAVPTGHTARSNTVQPSKTRRLARKPKGGQVSQAGHCNHTT